MPQKKTLSQLFKKPAFTLIEVIIVIFILASAMMGALYLLSSVIKTTAENQKRVTAIYLAQECVELVRNIRDTAWKKRLPWDCAFSSGGDFIVEAGIGKVCKDNNFGVRLEAFANQGKLFLDNAKYTHATSETPTPFFRKVQITPKENSVEALCIVKWGEKSSNIITMSAIFTNWKKK